MSYLTVQVNILQTGASKIGLSYGTISISLTDCRSDALESRGTFGLRA